MCPSTSFNVLEWENSQIRIIQGLGDLSSEVFFLTTSRTEAADNNAIKD